MPQVTATVRPSAVDAGDVGHFYHAQSSDRQSVTATLVNHTDALAFSLISAAFSRDACIDHKRPRSTLQFTSDAISFPSSYYTHHSAAAAGLNWNYTLRQDCAK